jgi:hypothetical protein
MKHLTHWILALATLVTVASFTGAWSAPQDPTGKPAKKLDRPQGAKKPGQQGRAEKQNSIKKVLPTLKTSLVEAIALAEKESSGKAYSASVEVREGKPMIQVSLFANDKHTMTSVDPETKKVTILGKPAEGPGGGEGAGGGAGSGDGEGEGEEGG